MLENRLVKIKSTDNNSTAALVETLKPLQKICVYRLLALHPKTATVAINERIIHEKKNYLNERKVYLTLSLRINNEIYEALLEHIDNIEAYYPLLFFVENGKAIKVIPQAEWLRHLQDQAVTEGKQP